MPRFGQRREKGSPCRTMRLDQSAWLRCIGHEGSRARDA
jgi:hypothetical protein